MTMVHAIFTDVTHGVHVSDEVDSTDHSFQLACSDSVLDRELELIECVAATQYVSHVNRYVFGALFQRWKQEAMSAHRPIEAYWNEKAPKEAKKFTRRTLDKFVSFYNILKEQIVERRIRILSCSIPFDELLHALGRSEFWDAVHTIEDSSQRPLVPNIDETGRMTEPCLLSEEAKDEGLTLSISPCVSFPSHEEQGQSGKRRRSSRRRNSTQTVHQEGLDDFFTHPEVVDRCVHLIQSKIQPLITENAMGRSQCFVLDSSAGNNRFCRTLGWRHLAVDIKQYESEDGEVLIQSWFDTKRLPAEFDGSTMQLAIGFNPPFGKRYHLIHEFVEHAIRCFEPDWFFWLVPVHYQMRPSQQQWYDVIVSERVGHDAFYRPETGQIGGASLCEFRVYRRRLDPRKTLGISLRPRFPKPTDSDDTDGLPISILPLASLMEGVIHKKQVNSSHLMLIRSRGRLAGRQFLMPQPDNEILCMFKDVEESPCQTLSWDEFLGKTSSLTFYVFLWKTTAATMDRLLFRNRWIEAWKHMAPHSFEPNNTIRMNLSLRECYSILRQICVPALEPLDHPPNSMQI